MAKKNKYTGKFVVAFDTIVDGNQCTMTEDNTPLLFNSYDEAFKEIFDDAHSMLSNRSAAELKEYNEGITKAIVNKMRKVLESGDVEAMERFMCENPNCNDNNEWVEPADKFIMNRKIIVGATGGKVTGTKLK